MIKFSQLKESAFAVRDEMEAEASTAIVDTSATDSETIEENTVHLKPHGGKGTHYQVVKGVKGHLEAGEVIHDSEVDDLHDMGYKVKHLKEDGTEVAEEGEAPLAEEQLDELSKATLNSYADKAGKSALSMRKDNKQSSGTGNSKTYDKINKRNNSVERAHDKVDGYTNRVKVLAKEDLDTQLSEADWKLGAAADKGLSKEDEIAVAKGTRYGDYKGHRAEMKKKHGIGDSKLNEAKDTSYEHYEKHAALYHHHLDNDDDDTEANKHYNIVKKNHGAKIANELQHTENSKSARATTFKNY